MIQDDTSVASRLYQPVSPAGLPVSDQPVPPNGVADPMPARELHSSNEKVAGRGNALRHGLTARTLLPQVFQEGQIDQFLTALQEEWQPATPTERVLVEELARHAAALGRAHQAEGAVLRESAFAALGLWPIEDDVPEDSRDRLLAGSVTTDAVERLTRYRRAHEKGFFAALVKLREARASRQRPVASVPISIDPFQAEADCAIYLLRRWQRKECRCPRCGARLGYWLTSRQRWQCAACHHQVGLRAGTVMAGSHLPLSTWFRAIRLFVQNPNVSNAALRKAIATHRPATACKIGEKIRAAFRSGNASALLAGLDRVFGRAIGVLLHKAPSGDQNLQNELACPDAESRIPSHGIQGG